MRATGIATEHGFYVTGGTLRRDAPSYVERQADRVLYESLLQGKFCYVLTSRQMGKSSLMVRTAARLREDGVGVAVLDLTAAGPAPRPAAMLDEGDHRSRLAALSRGVGNLRRRD
jgi:hypothetical protein